MLAWFLVLFDRAGESNCRKTNSNQPRNDLLISNIQAGIVPAKTETVGKYASDLRVPGEIGDIIQIASWVLGELVDGGMDFAFTQGEAANNGFDSAGGSQGVANHTFGTAYRDLVGSFTKNCFDSFGFSLVTCVCARAMCVYVADFIKVGFRIRKGG